MQGDAGYLYGHLVSTEGWRDAKGLAESFMDTVAGPQPLGVAASALAAGMSPTKYTQ